MEFTFDTLFSLWPEIAGIWVCDSEGSFIFRQLAAAATTPNESESTTANNVPSSTNSELISARSFLLDDWIQNVLFAPTFINQWSKLGFGAGQSQIFQFRGTADSVESVLVLQIPVNARGSSNTANNNGFWSLVVWFLTASKGQCSAATASLVNCLKDEQLVKKYEADSGSVLSAGPVLNGKSSSASSASAKKNNNANSSGKQKLGVVERQSNSKQVGLGLWHHLLSSIQQEEANGV